MRLHATLPDRQVSPETKDVVRLGMGLVATMTALLLGLMIATAKGSYDAQRSEVIQIASKVAFIDRALSRYGPETSEERELLRRAVETAIPRMWPNGASATGQRDSTVSEGSLLYDAIVKMALSARCYDRVRNVARTIAYLAGADTLGVDHLAEALQIRLV